MKAKAPVAEGPSARAVALKQELFGTDFTVDAAAHILGVDRSTVLRYLRDHVIFGIQVGDRWHISEQDIRDFHRQAIEKARRRTAAPTIDDWSV